MDTTNVGSFFPLRKPVPDFSHLPVVLPPPNKPENEHDSTPSRWWTQKLMHTASKQMQQPPAPTWGASRLFSRSIEVQDQKNLVSCICPSLTLEERIYGFLSCYAIGCALSFSAFMSMHALMNGNPTPFAIRYTVGNLLGLFSTAFLVGPREQYRKMMAPVRVGATTIYLGTIATTLGFALLREPTLTLASMLLQLIALAWYCLSYVPFGRQLLRRCCFRC